MDRLPVVNSTCELLSEVIGLWNVETLETVKIVFNERRRPTAAMPNCTQKLSPHQSTLPPVCHCFYAFESQNDNLGFVTIFGAQLTAAFYPYRVEVCKFAVEDIG